MPPVAELVWFVIVLPNPPWLLRKIFVLFVFTPVPNVPVPVADPLPLMEVSLLGGFTVALPLTEPDGLV